MSLVKKLLVLVPLLSYGSHSFANDSDELYVAVMPSIFTQESVYVGGENVIGVFPLFDISWKGMFFSAGKFGVEVFNYKNISISAGVGVDLLGDVDRGDSKILKDMTNLDTAFTGNIDFNATGSLGNVSFTIAKDISNVHDGYTLDASYSYHIELGDFFIEPSIGVTFAGAKVADYYYGVSSVDVTPDRMLYEIDSTVNYNFSILAGYTLSEKSALMGFVSIDVLDSAIEDSPIVAEGTATTVGIGYRYQF